MISINSVFKYMDTKEERVRIIEIDGPSVYIVNIDAATSMPKKEDINKIKEEIEANKLVKIKDPYLRIIDYDKLSNLQKSMRDEDWKFIQKYWENYKSDILDKSRRTKALEYIVKDSNKGMTKVKRVFSRFWQRGMNKNSLIPDYAKSGGKGKEKELTEIKTGKPRNVDYYGNGVQGINITSDVKRHFEIVVNKYYRSKNKISLKETYTLMLRDFYSDSYKVNGEIEYRIWDSSRIPTYHQFYYWFKKKENIQKDIIFRESEKEFNLNNRALLSNSKQETDGPGTRFQVDATIADVYLVSSLNRNRVIGRPIVYAIIDVFSRMVTGIYVGLEGPSWIGAMMTLDNMIENKVEYCRKYGIEMQEEQWPCKHLPEIIIADRGEFEGFSVENLINNLNIKIENTSPYRGDLKGIVERSFRTTNEKIKHKTPGAILKEFRKRGDRDYRLDATLTLEEFTKIYINIVLNHNSKIIDKYPLEKEMIADEITPTPINLWNWGIKNRKGRLKTLDREILRLNILPKGKASVSRAGIRFKGLYYSSDKAVKEQWFINLKVRNIEIVYDPRNVDKIYIPSENGLDYDECYLIDTSKQYKGCILEEIIFNEELASELKDKEIREQNQNNIDLENEIEKIVKEAQKAKEKELDYNQTSNKKLKGIKRNRTVEKEVNRIAESFDIGKSVYDSDTESKVISFPNVEDKIDNNQSSAKSKLMDKLRKKRDEKREK
ncbi:Mu transposase C-terminal domain-containing protein [Hathewaya histolytica]|uniref:Mu transposase C-terminal domain-containing protein n=1 Tax=Hathewaya histolytica TaxID=1498 RepID=UPI003B66F8A2